MEETKKLETQIRPSVRPSNQMEDEPQTLATSSQSTSNMTTNSFEQPSRDSFGRFSSSSQDLQDLEETSGETLHDTQLEGLAEHILQEEQQEETGIITSQVIAPSNTHLLNFDTSGKIITNESEVLNQLEETHFTSNVPNQNPLELMKPVNQTSSNTGPNIEDLKQTPWLICFGVVNFDLELGQSKS